MKRIKSKPFIIFVFVAIALLFAVRFMSSQDNSKNTIRVLIDRYPQSQTLDITAQKIKPLIDEFHYQMIELPDEDRVVLTHTQKPTIEFKVVRDEVTRALLFLRGDADVLYNTLSLAKTEWIRNQKHDLKVFEADGATLSYLGFQTRHPILGKKEVRLAIAESLPIDEWVQYKFLNWVVKTNEVKAPDFQVVHANQLLDQAGYPIKNGTRFSLRYFTTPVREGNELAQLVREALKKVGIEVQLINLETSLFFAKIQKGDFDLISTRWFRTSANAPAAEILKMGARRNYLDYESAALEAAFAKNPNATLKDLAPIIEDQLPLIPLFNWKHGLIIGHRIKAPSDISVSLDESFRFLSRIELIDELK